jgi:tetratricopeptide (TPR) repeat protein
MAILLALTLTTGQSFLPVASIAPAFAQDARATKDFKHRRRIIVPSSDASRRIDYQALPGRDSLMLPNYHPKFPPENAGASQYGYGATNMQLDSSGSNAAPSGLPPAETGAMSARAESLGGKTINPINGKTSRAGLVPPPPPAKSSLLPSSLTHEPHAPAPASAHAKAAPALSAQKVAQIKAEAQALVKKGKPAEAQALLTGHIKNYPNEKALSQEMGKISLTRAQGHAKAGNHEAAVQQARLAVFHGDSSPEIVQAAHTTLNGSLKKVGVTAHAADARMSQATKLLHEGRYNEAEVEFRAAAKIKPSVDAYLGAGNAAMKEDRKLQAKAFYQEALELNPDSQPALKELGIVRYHLKDYAGANADLTRSLVLNSSDQEAAHTLIELWQHQVASRPQDANAHLGLARAYQVVGDLPAAQNAYKTVVKIHPQHPNLPAARQSFKLAFARQEAKKAYEMARTLETQGSIQSAWQKANEAVSLYPSDKNYQTYRTELTAKLQNPGMISSAPASMAAPAMPGAPMTMGMAPVAAGIPAPQASTLTPEPSAEAPPTLNLPTAQAIGIAPEAAASAAAAAPGASDPLAGGTALNTDRQVSSISTFLGGLRDMALQQQNQALEAEATSMWSLNTYKRPLGGIPTTELGLGTTTITSTTSTASGLPAASGVPSAIQALPQSSSANDALKTAALALANTKGMSGVPGLSGLAATDLTASPVASSVATNPTLGASALAAAAAAAPSLLANKFNGVTRQDTVTATQSYSAANYAQPAYAQPTYSQPVYGQQAYAPQAYAQPAYTAPTQQYTQSVQPAYPPTSQPTFAPSQPAYTQQAYAQQAAVQPNYSQPPTINSTQPSQPNYSPPAPSPVPMAAGTQSMEAPKIASQPLAQSAAQSMQPAMASGGVALLLQGVKAAKNDVQLKVVLRNQTQQDIKLPGTMKAMVRNGGQEKAAKASFSSKSVSAGGSVNGTITIAGSNLDPTADVVILADSLNVAGMGDLHLTVPISQR